MLNFSDAHHFRKVVAGICMLCAPLLFLASAIASPPLKQDEGPLLSSISGHLDRWYIASLLGFVGLIVFLPAILGLMHMLRERQTAFGHVGGAIALIGFVAAAANAGLTASLPMQVIAAAVLLVGLGAIGWMVLSETDDQWEHTPEVRGFRPAAGHGLTPMWLARNGGPPGRPTVAWPAQAQGRP